MKTNENCIFCKIARGDVPADKIWENEKYVAFLDMRPMTEGHTLIIPKRHANYLFDLPDKEYSELMLAAKKVAKLLKEKLKVRRVGVIVEGFMVPHIHIHLVPINKGSDMRPGNAKPRSPEELKRIAKKIKS